MENTVKHWHPDCPVLVADPKPYLTGRWLKVDCQECLERGSIREGVESEK